jgi:hypothetical protein
LREREAPGEDARDCGDGGIEDQVDDRLSPGELPMLGVEAAVDASDSSAKDPARDRSDGAGGEIFGVTFL